MNIVLKNNKVVHVIYALIQYCSGIIYINCLGAFKMNISLFLGTKENFTSSTASRVYTHKKETIMTIQVHECYFVLTYKIIIYIYYT